MNVYLFAERWDTDIEERVLASSKKKAWSKLKKMYPTYWNRFSLESVRKSKKKTKKQSSNSVKVKVLWNRLGYYVVGRSSKKRISKTAAQRYFKRWKVKRKYWSKKHRAKVYHLG